MSEAAMEQCSRCKKNITSQRQYVITSNDHKEYKVVGRLCEPCFPGHFYRPTQVKGSTHLSAHVQESTRRTPEQERIERLEREVERLGEWVAWFQDMLDGPRPLPENVTRAMDELTRMAQENGEYELPTTTKIKAKTLADLEEGIRAESKKALDEPTTVRKIFKQESLQRPVPGGAHVRPAIGAKVLIKEKALRERGVFSEPKYQTVLRYHDNGTDFELSFPIGWFGVEDIDKVKGESGAPAPSLPSLLFPLCSECGSENVSMGRESGYCNDCDSVVFEGGGGER